VLARLLLGTSLMAAQISLAAAGGAEQQVSANGFPATLTVPIGVSDPPMVFFIAGSGPTDRNGNSPLGVEAGYLGKLAHALADGGLGSLRYDKRGVPGGVAVADESTVTFQTYLDDAKTVLDWLHESSSARPVFVLGHSEGGLVALYLAGVRPEVAGVILLATPGRPPAETLRDQIMQHMTDPLRRQALDILARLEAGAVVDDVPASLIALFRPSVQPFLRSLLALDPAARLGASPIPALVIGGGRDLQVGRADFDALSANALQGSSLWLPEMNHVLAAVDTDDRQANLATYASSDGALAPGLVAAISTFVREFAGTRNGAD